GFVLTRDPVYDRGLLLAPATTDVPKGAKVYLTRSAAFDEYAAGILKSRRDIRELVPVRLRFTVGADGIPTLLGTIPLPDGTRKSHTVAGESPLLPAKTRPLSADLVRVQLEKTSGTVFSVTEFTADIEGAWFAPPGILNRLRRDLITGLEEILVRASCPEEPLVAEARNQGGIFASGFAPEAIPCRSTEPGNCGRPGISLYTDTMEGVRAGVSAGADRVYFEPLVRMPGCPPSENGRNAWYRDLLSLVVAALETAAGMTGTTGTQVIWKLPGIVRDRFLEHACPRIPELLSRGIAGCMVEDSGAGKEIRRSHPGCVLSGGAGLNLFNGVSLRALSPPFSLLTLSPELSSGDIRELVQRLPGPGKPAVEMLVQGNLEVMVTEDRLLSLLVQPGFPGTCFGLRDGTGRVFPVAEDSECRTRLRNAVELCLIDRLPEILDAGVGSVAIDARGRSPDYVAGMVGAYRAAADVLAHDGPDSRSRLASLKEEIRGNAWGGITTGHFVRKTSPD
ncbi:MAG: DUF3656 domain-containing protein, partial [Methanoregulaceae archaeon]